MTAAVAVSLNWRDRSACATSSVNFFAEDEVTIARAKQVCAICPVRVECGAAGHDQEFGIWGGKTPDERGYTSTRAQAMDRCLSCGGALVAINQNRDRCLSCDAVWFR